jgi:shikimate kinase
MNVVLIGMKHCGKSTLGAALARRWRCAFYDVDTMIEDTHACDTGIRAAVREIFARFGEDHFHQVEGHVVCELYLKLQEPERPHVVALGGRTATNERVRDLLAGIGTIVYIRVPPDELYRRVKASGLPPFVDAGDPQASFDEILRQREPEYERLADLTVDVGGLSVDAAADELVRRLQEYAHAG